MTCKRNVDYTLYLVTDRALMRTATLVEAVREACAGGVTLVQLREKGMPRDALVRHARSVKEACDEFGVALIVNDDARAAVEAGAAGVHVGQGDMPAAQARKVVGPDMIVGVSAHTVREARAAERAGADYLGVGALAGTSTKGDARLLSPDGLKGILGAVRIPCVGIGGMNATTIPRFADAGLSGFAAVSAIIAQDDVRGAARNLRALIEGGRKACACR